MSDFVKRKEDWLRAVVSQIHEWRTAAVAVELGSYFNSKTGEAWPSVDTLATALNTDRRTIQRALKQLRAEGFLALIGGGKGRGDSHCYRMHMPQQERAAHLSPKASKRAAQLAQKGGSAGTKRAAHLSPEPLNQPLKNRRRCGGAEKRFNSAGKNNAPSNDTSKPRQPRQRAQPRAQHFPPHYRCGPAEYAAAERIAGWDQAKAFAEFNRTDGFRDWHMQRSNRSTDWRKSWAAWCHKGVEIEQRDAKRSKSKAEEGSAGVARWLRRQHATDDHDIVE